jgi:hypothetical protein
MAAEFAPGCFANFGPNVRESFCGILLRLAEANHYANIGEFLHLTLGIRKQYLSTHLSRATIDVRTDGEQLQLLGRIAVGSPQALKHFSLEMLAEEALFIEGCRVDLDAWLENAAQVCPECLTEDAFAREAWDLAPVACCSRHRVALLDACTKCGRRLEWNRPFLCRCSQCGTDLRTMRTVTVTAEAATAAEDFAALAPFRVGLDDGSTITAMWDTMFRVLKCLALPIRFFRERDWPERGFFCRLTAARRLEVLEELGKVREGAVYQLGRLRPVLLSPLVCLDGVPRKGLAARVAFKVLHSGAGLPREIAAELTSLEAAAVQSLGAEVFKGRPPSMTTEGEVTEFLDVDPVTLEGLANRRLWAVPSEGEPFDIDELLVAGNFLAHELLTSDELAKVAGTAVRSEDLRLSPLLTRWNQASETDLRVELDSVCDVQLSLLDRLTHCLPPGRPTSAGHLASATDRPFLALTMLVGLVLSGGLGKASWAAPFTWSSLMLDEDEVAAFAGRHHSAFPLAQTK